MKKYLESILNYLFISLCCLSAFAINHLDGTSGAWTNTSAGAWDNGANWTANPSFPNSFSDVALFIEKPTTGVISSGQNISLLSLVMDVPTGDSLTIQFPPPFTLSFAASNGAQIYSTGNGTKIINTPLVLQSIFKILDDTDGTAPLTISGDISGNGGINFFSFTQSNPLEPSTIQGPGFILEGTNTYAFNTNIFGGLLQLNSSVGPSIPTKLNIIGTSKVQTLLDNQFSNISEVVPSKGGILDIRGTTQTILKTIMFTGNIIDSSFPASTSGVLNLLEAFDPLTLFDESLVSVPRINLVNGGIIRQDNTSISGKSTIGDITGTSTFILDLNNHNVFITSSDQSTRFDLRMINPVIINGSITCTRFIGPAGVILLEGTLGGSIPTFTIRHGSVIIGPTSSDFIGTSGPTIVQTDGLLGGFGTLGISGSANVSNAGIIQPGNATEIGTFTISGNYTQTSTGTLSIKAKSNTQADKLVVTGSVTLDGILFFDGGKNVTIGDIVVLDSSSSNSSISGTFSNFLANVPEGLNATVIYKPHHVIVRISFACKVKPPTNLRAKQFENKFLTQTDHINQLKWSPSISVDVVEYHVYRNGKLIGVVGALDVLEFDDHVEDEDESFHYAVTAVDSHGQESAPARLTFPKHESS